MDLPTIIVDGGIIHRYYYGGGEDAADLFVRAIGRVCEEYFPRDVMVAFDEGRARRQEIFPDYKSNRPEKPQDLKEQIARAKERVNVSGAQLISVAGYEADDVIASVCHQEQQAGRRVAIASVDKDFRQCLVDGQVSISRDLNYRIPPLDDWVTAANHLEDYGFPASQWIDYQILVGDSTDCVPGVNGIGDVAARKILAQYELAQILENPFGIDGLSGKQAESIEAAQTAGLIDIFRELFTLKTDLNLEEANA